LSDIRSDMDQSVLDSIVRWPNVPAVAGWLSLSSRGEWRLHPNGDAQQGGPGVGVSNTQILSFFGRNYSNEQNGQYFFQNGPQRVYVRLDAAPYVLHLSPEDGTLRTHNSLIVKQIKRWLIDDLGNVYADTDIGPARIDDRDLFLLADLLFDELGANLLDRMEAGEQHSNRPLRLGALATDRRFPVLNDFAPTVWMRPQEIATEMKFVANPAVPLK
jgi:hypothetical protein